MGWDVHRNGNPNNTSIGYTMCRYINWIDEVNVVCNIQYNKHMRMRTNNYMNINLVTLAEHTSEAPTTANKQTQAEQKGGAGPENCQELKLKATG